MEEDIDNIQIKETWIFNNRFVNLSISGYRMVGYIDWFAYNVYKTNKKVLIELIKKLS